jgi:hypothetical protein
MMKKITLQSRRKMALIAGFSLIIMAIAAGFAYGYAFQNIYVATDSAATLAKLKQSPFLFRLMIFLFTIVLLLDVIVSWALYFFFRQKNSSLALLMSWTRLVYAALLGIALLCLVFVLQLINDAEPNGTFVMMGFKTFLDMWSLGLVIFGCHLLLLGYLIFASGDVPKFIGVLALFAAVCYIASNSANLLLVNYEQYKATVDLLLGLPMALGELALAFWLIFRGGKTT